MGAKTLTMVCHRPEGGLGGVNYLCHPFKVPVVDAIHGLLPFSSLVFTGACQTAQFVVPFDHLAYPAG